MGMGVTHLARTCGSEPVVGAMCAAVVGSVPTGHEFDAGSDRTYATLVTSDGHSLKQMMRASGTLIISAEQHERLLAADIVSRRNVPFFILLVSYLTTLLKAIY